MTNPRMMLLELLTGLLALATVTAVSPCVTVPRSDHPPRIAWPHRLLSYDDPEWPPDPTPGSDDDEPSGVGRS